MPERFNAGSPVPEISRGEKESELARIRTRVRELRDALGKPVEAGIEETVVFLNAHGLPTTQSCEGHLDPSEEHRKSLAPYAEIGFRIEEGELIPHGEDYTLTPEGQAKWRENVKFQARTLELFDEFYQDRQVSVGTRVAFRSIGAYGEFRITNVGADTLQQFVESGLLSRDDPEVREKHEAYRAEMEAFTEFLKRKYEETPGGKPISEPASS